MHPFACTGALAQIARNRSERPIDNLIMLALTVGNALLVVDITLSLLLSSTMSEGTKKQ
jgi:hypothetical protein